MARPVRLGGGQVLKRALGKMHCNLNSQSGWDHDKDLKPGAVTKIGAEKGLRTAFPLQDWPL